MASGKTATGTVAAMAVDVSTDIAGDGWDDEDVDNIDDGEVALEGTDGFASGVWNQFVCVCVCVQYFDFLFIQG